MNNFLTDYNFTCGSHFFANQAAKTAASVSTYLITQVPTKHLKLDFRPIDQNVWSWVGRCHAGKWYYSVYYFIACQFNSLKLVPLNFRRTHMVLVERTISLAKAFHRTGEIVLAEDDRNVDLVCEERKNASSIERQRVAGVRQASSCTKICGAQSRVHQGTQV